MADVNTNTNTATQTQGNGTQTNTTANANTTGAGADSTPKVKTEEEIRAELQKEYEKMADKRVTDAIKKKEKEWADKQAKEKMTEDERRQAEEQERLQAQAKRDLDLTIKGLKLDVVDAVQEMGLDAGFRNLIAVEDLATITDEDERKAKLTERVKGMKKLFDAEVAKEVTNSFDSIIDDNGREFVDGVGIPIGNYVSQYDGNFNLSVVDHWLKEVKGVKYYFRYMDDMVIFGSSKEELHKLKRELDEFMAVNLKQVLKHNWQVFPTKVRGVDFVGYRFFGEYTLLRKSTCKTFKRRMLSISSKRENNVSPTYSEWCSFNSYVGWLQHCDSFRLYQKYVEPNIEYMHNYYLKEVKGNAEICKRKNYSGERKAS